MKRSIFANAVLATVVLLGASGSDAAVLVNETFNYTNGPLTTVSAGAWVGYNGTTPINVLGGQAVVNMTNSQDAGINLSTPVASNGVVYAGFDATFLTLPTGVGAYFAAFKDTTNINFRARVQVTNVAGQVQIGIGNSSSQPTNPGTAFWGTPLPLGTTYRVVVKLDQSSGVDVSTLWINPALETDLSVTASDPVAGGPQQMSVVQFALRQSNTATGAGVLTVDNLVVGTTFSDAAVTLPSANFSASPTNGASPLVVTFTDTSTGTITNRFWDFGDGTTSNTTAITVAKTYNAGGFYTVSLTVTGPFGASTNTRSNYIAASPTDYQTWQLQFFGCFICPQAGPSADPDGDGQSNLTEYLSGTDPTNSMSGLRISAVARQDNDICVTWTSVGGKGYVLQSTKAAAIATYTTNFADVSPIIVAAGAGESTTNYLDAGALYATALTSPGSPIVGTGTSSTVYMSATNTHGLADSVGGAVPIGSLLMFGTFNISESAIQSNFYSGNLSTIMSAFTPYDTPFSVGEGTGLPASWDVSRSASGYGGQQIYLLAVDRPTLAAATHLGIFTAPSWVFPENGSDLYIALEDVTDFVIGKHGGPLTINIGLGQTYTFSDTVMLSYLPAKTHFYRVRLVP